VQAMLIISNKEVVGDEPGLESVAMAIPIPDWRISFIGGGVFSLKK